ncbi:hypothetical protein [Gordonia neofelifaecis]|uniref:DoxX family protein n=1 Tax=Gordonia neofelifaecis NRRL B-59395 TaxID=644548 RepID=F1YF39_9ACTN|nr:hypothetical protein [Gordonia neofelifaecis]EGD56407.1 hypothetical protein SCNU_02602 [Gordonia neofelifaecis NRRL B-59395]
MTESAENCSCATSNRLATVGGAVLAATGVAHFVVPGPFRALTATAFPDNVDQAMQVNGAIETAVGTAIAIPRTRKVGVVGLGLYGAYLATNAVKARMAG